MHNIVAGLLIIVNYLPYRVVVIPQVDVDAV